MSSKSTGPARARLKEILRSEVFAAAYWVGAFAVVVVMAYFHMFRYRLGLPFSENPAVWGAFGDYVGGILNPVCAYMAFLWLVRSYALQKAELAETRDALERTQEAQQRQAEIAFASARIETANIRLSIIGRKISNTRAELADAKVAHSRGLVNGHYLGESVPYQHAISLLISDLNAFETHQTMLLEQINQIEGSLISNGSVNSDNQKKQ